MKIKIFPQYDGFKRRSSIRKRMTELSSYCYQVTCHFFTPYGSNPVGYQVQETRGFIHSPKDKYGFFSVYSKTGDDHGAMIAHIHANCFTGKTAGCRAIVDTVLTSTLAREPTEEEKMGILFSDSLPAVEESSSVASSSSAVETNTNFFSLEEEKEFMMIFKDGQTCNVHLSVLNNRIRGRITLNDISLMHSGAGKLFLAYIYTDQLDPTQEMKLKMKWGVGIWKHFIHLLEEMAKHQLHRIVAMCKQWLKDHGWEERGDELFHLLQYLKEHPELSYARQFVMSEIVHAHIAFILSKQGVLTDLGIGMTEELIDISMKPERYVDHPVTIPSSSFDDDIQDTNWNVDPVVYEDTKRQLIEYGKMI